MTLVRNYLSSIQKDPQLPYLETLCKEIHKMGNQSKTYGNTEAALLCEQLELSLIVKIKNFHLSTLPPSWFQELDLLLKKMETATLSTNNEGPMAEEKRTKKRIVVVDDDEDLLKLIDYEFRALGFEITSFQTGKTALTFLLDPKNTKDVSLLILDRMLPDMDGLEILPQLKALSQPPPVLILSALDAESDILAGLQEGAVDYITKPFSVFLLMQKSLNLLKT
jgi:CheY-like chemotaxis protein